MAWVIVTESLSCAQYPFGHSAGIFLSFFPQVRSEFPGAIMIDYTLPSVVNGARAAPAAGVQGGGRW